MDRSKQSKPKIVRIIGRLNIGGPARQACALHEALRDEFETRLIAGRLDVGEGDMSHLLQSQEGVLWLPAMSRPISLWADLRAWIEIYRFLRRERPQIVHTHTAKAGALGRTAAWLAGVPVRVHTFHGHVLKDYFGAVTQAIYRGLERMLARMSTVVVTVSRTMAEELSNELRIVPAEKMRVIHNGFEVQEPAPGVRERLRKEWSAGLVTTVVLWAGRFAPVKGVPLLAEVVKRCAADPGLLFVVAGDGTERAEFEAETKCLQNVRLLGWQSEMTELLAACDAVLLTSVNEGTPTVMIEAMFAGKPFVATRVGGVGDLAAGAVEACGNGAWKTGNGFLAERSVGPIVSCLEALRADPQLARAMGAAWKKFACEQFTFARLTEDVRGLYREMLGNRVIGSSGH